MSADQTAATAANRKEIDLVRDLARQVAQIAADPENEAARRRWCDVNALRKPDRAPVWCRPVGAWNELLPEDALVCRDRWLRSIERIFRKVVIKKDIGDDDLVDNYFPVSTVARVEPGNVWGLEPKHVKPAESDGAWHYDPPLKCAADFDKLVLPRLTIDQAATDRALSRTHDLLGDILPVRRTFAPNAIHGFTATLGTPAADLRGLEQMMMDAIAEPELLHRLMAHLRDGVLSLLDQAEKSGLLTPNNDGPMICSDPVGAPIAQGAYTLKNCWAMPNSQEFDQISPAMWEEFCLNYQRPVLEKFGLTWYGCCENLTRKIDGVLSIPNLRIFVCSAWTNLDTVLQKVGPQYVIMWRQKASDVVFAEDESVLRNQLETGMRKLQGRPYQIVLRELQTLNGRLDWLHRWTRHAKEIAAKYA